MKAANVPATRWENRIMPATDQSRTGQPARQLEQTDDPMCKRLRKTLAGGRLPPVVRPPRQLQPALQMSSQACTPEVRVRAETGPARPVAKQVQHEEYTQPLRANQRQWT
jgi:hypothetical protein